MAYDEGLADRVRAALDGEVPGTTERKMFGGLAFLLDGHMVCGVIGDALMLRLGPELGDTALTESHVRPMDFTGKPMRGMVYVDAAGIAEDAALAGWVSRALGFVTTLPPKR
jgi:hypothetical protein